MVSTAALASGMTSLVTGAGSGIGRAVALAFAAEGAEAIGLLDVDRDRAMETARLLKDWSGRTLVIAADVGRAGDADAAVERVVEEFGRLDCAVNNAGIRGDRTDVADYTDEQWHSVLNVNLSGTFFCLRAEVRAMRSAGHGAIVNVSSGVVMDPAPGLSAYTASKFGVVGLTCAVAGECTPYGIRINAVLPGSTSTPLQQDYLRRNPEAARSAESMPMGRFGEPAEVAEAVLWLCSPRASFVHGARLLVDGGSHGFALPVR